MGDEGLIFILYELQGEFGGQSVCHHLASVEVSCDYELVGRVSPSNVIDKKCQFFFDCILIARL